MKTINRILLLLLLPVCVYASGNEAELEEANVNLNDKKSLLRGAGHYVTYCLGCHSAKHFRYLNVAHDFGATEEQVLKEIAPEGATIYDKMLTAMNAHDANRWFGIKPPDLSLIARARGADWLYSYLKGFYSDPGKPLGTNNTIFKDVGMPNVFWQVQGTQEAVITEENGQQVLEGLVLTEPGKLSPKEFDQLVTDLVNFLVFIGEPHQQERRSLGIFVLLFIAIFTYIAYLLKKEYWKDIY